MDSLQARRFLEQFPRFDVKPGLDRIQRMLQALGNPELAYPAVHVAGTNGKGSVVAMLDAVLRAAGLRTGRYTSPELLDFRDRITVNGEWISPEDLASGVARLAPHLDGWADPPSQFEVITAIALDHFARSKVEVAVIEVGLGGRYDATNAVRAVTCILTNVSLDHQHLLGDTVEAIAWEKAGIIKPSGRVIIGDLQPGVERIVRTECRAVGAELLGRAGVAVERISRDWHHARYRVVGVRGVTDVSLPLIGSTQAQNLGLVLRALLELREQGFSIPSRAVEEGLRCVVWPGRFETMRVEPTVVLDGAHNPAGLQQLVTDIVEMSPRPEDRSVLYGSLQDKDVEAALSILRSGFEAIHVCASASPRSVPVPLLASMARKHFSCVSEYDTVGQGMGAWLASAGRRDALFVTGSLTVVGDARRWWTETG